MAQQGVNEKPELGEVDIAFVVVTPAKAGGHMGFLDADFRRHDEYLIRFLDRG